MKTAELPIKEDPKLVELRQNMDYSTQQAANRRLTAAQISLGRLSTVVVFV